MESSIHNWLHNLIELRFKLLKDKILVKLKSEGNETLREVLNGFIFFNYQKDKLEEAVEVFELLSSEINLSKFKTTE